MHNFFQPHATPISAKVALPSLIQVSWANSHTTLSTVWVPTANSTIMNGCPEAHQILSRFHNRIKMLPTSFEEATDDHPLAQFSGDPVGCMGEV